MDYNEIDVDKIVEKDHELVSACHAHVQYNICLFHRAHCSS